jgi:hypothetical protein
MGSADSNDKESRPGVIPGRPYLAPRSCFRLGHLGYQPRAIAQPDGFPRCRRTATAACRPASLVSHPSPRTGVPAWSLPRSTHVGVPPRRRQVICEGGRSHLHRSRSEPAHRTAREIPGSSSIWSVWGWPQLPVAGQPLCGIDLSSPCARPPGCAGLGRAPRSTGASPFGDFTIGGGSDGTEGVEHLLLPFRAPYIYARRRRVRAGFSTG